MKKFRKKTTQSARLQGANTAQTQMFTFGEPIPMLDKADMMNYLYCSVANDRWFNPPISWSGLAKSLRASTHHESAITVKANLLADTCVINQPHILTHTALVSFIKDYYVFGNAYFEAVRNRLGKIIRLEAPLAKYMRKGVEDGRYFYIGNHLDEHEFSPNSIFHFIEPDINQDIYGLPHYLSALQSAWLNESATLFRRKYYLNGAHAGFVFYMSDAAQKQDDIENLRKQLRESKGVGNFKNLFIHSPNGKKDGIQIIPIADVAAKDEFFNIKNVSRDDILAAHRVPPQLMGIIPNNTGGFGDIEKAAKVFLAIEIIPLQKRLQAINHWFGSELLTFKPSSLLSEPQP
ncbi:phage portal protein [Muribacter muris]|uniref:Phage portal protein n=1 Tax=Muribacter muris TaxID=67855 RepID=A0A4Y9K9J6_9PAST|nr:phage portal protein [Muribacter muris]MBF0783898.1 phage portal protein [Muribacter muris]MBF0826396.1 phage portal protein [Muribacter muris]TFV13295.1 phage portal protein [Muribacter muris]